MVFISDDGATKFSQPDTESRSSTTVGDGSTTSALAGVPVTEPDGTPVTNPRGSVVTRPPTTRGTVPGGGPAPTNPGGTTQPTAGPTTTAEPLRISMAMGSDRLSACEGGQYPSQTRVVGSTSGGIEPTNLWLHRDTNVVLMQKTGPNWYATLGPFSSGAVYSVFVSDSPGSGGTKSLPRNLTVEPCPQ